MPPESTSGTGQVPPTSQSPDGNGQVPPTSQDATTAHGDSGNSEPSSSLTFEQLQDRNKKLSAENAKNRVDAKRLAELEAAEQQRQEAVLSDKERYEKKISALEAQVAEEKRLSQERTIRAEVRSVAQGLGLKAELAIRLLDMTAVTLNDDGDPTNIADLLKTAMEEYGLTPAQQQQQPASSSNPVPQLGATNPSRNGRGQQATLAANDPSQSARFGQGRNLFKNQ